MKLIRMHIFKYSFLFLFCAITIGCATQPPNKLTKAQQEALYSKNIEVAWAVKESEFDTDAKYIASRDRFVQELNELLIEKYNKKSAIHNLSADIKVIVSLYDRVSAIKGHWVGGGGNTVMATAIFKNSDTKALLSVYTIHARYGADGGLIGAAVQAASDPNVELQLAKRLIRDLDEKYHGD